MALGSRMNSNEELYTQYFNKYKMLIKDMDGAQRIQHKAELERVAFEARCGILAHDATERELDSEARQWLSPITKRPATQEESDAINAVKKRKERMSKAEKLDALLRDNNALGLSDEDVKSLMGTAAKMATASRADEFNQAKLSLVKSDNQPEMLTSSAESSEPLNTNIETSAQISESKPQNTSIFDLNK